MGWLRDDITLPAPREDPPLGHLLTQQDRERVYFVVREAAEACGIEHMKAVEIAEKTLGALL